MKTQIIQLEAHDDVISTRDKMGAGQASRILLVWPRKARPVHRKLDLVLLQRHSMQLGAQLGLVTTDEEVTFFADQLGIPVFKNSRLAQSHRWRAARRRLRLKKKQERPDLSEMRQALPVQPLEWQMHPLVRLAVFSASLAALLVLAAFLLPGALITLSPNREIQSLELEVRTDPDILTPQLTGGLPVHEDTIIVEGRNQMESSGTIQVPEKPAGGSIQFTNLTQERVDLPAGTIVTTLETPIIRFQTTQDASIPGGVGKKANVPIRAVVPGSSGNLPANSVQAIEGTLGLQLTANNPSPTRQGSDQPAASPTTSDQAQLYDSLKDELELTAIEELLSRIPADGTLADYPLRATLELSEVLDETYIPEIGLPSDQVTLILRLEFTFQYVAKNDLEALAGPILTANLPDGYQAVPETLRIYHADEKLRGNQDQAEWQITLEQDIQPVVTEAEAIDLAHGLPIEQAKSRLQAELELAQAPQIQITPGWWPYLPYLPFRIQVNIQSERN